MHDAKTDRFVSRLADLLGRQRDDLHHAFEALHAAQWDAPWDRRARKPRNAG